MKIIVLFRLFTLASKLSLLLVPCDFVQGIEKQETQIPGVTNLLYANAPVRMSDVSEKEEQINGNTITARPTSEDYLKEEEIDDDDIHVDESDEPDASGEADNTYYNIGGKRVAVAKLAEYINHKTQGELFNDFEVSTG